MPEQGCLLFCGGDPLFVLVHFTFVSVVEVYNFMIDLKFVALSDTVMELSVATVNMHRHRN